MAYLLLAILFLSFLIYRLDVGSKLEPRIIKSRGTLIIVKMLPTKDSSFDNSVMINIEKYLVEHQPTQPAVIDLAVMSLVFLIATIWLLASYRELYIKTPPPVFI